MGILDGMLGSVLGGGKGSAQKNALAVMLIAALVQNRGGIQNVFNQLRQGGLGSALDSWIGQGGNARAVSAGEIENALGQQTLSDLAQQTGVEPAQVSDLLAQFLPEAVNRATPNGREEEAAQFDLSDGLDIGDLKALATKFLK